MPASGFQRGWGFPTTLAARWRRARACACARMAGNAKLSPAVRSRRLVRAAVLAAGVAALASHSDVLASAWSAEAAPRPLLEKGGSPVDWWFAFKFNSSKSFAGCGKAAKGAEKRTCIFGGDVQAKSPFGQQYVIVSKGRRIEKGGGCLGATTTDPVGATFEQVYNGPFFYVIWNDQFYRDPPVRACKGESCGAPWGHSKGMLAWNDDGEGFVMQVSTPGWPRSGSKSFADRRPNGGNTLGCIKTNNNLRSSQHFFALEVNRGDLAKILKALRNASVVTDPNQLQIVRNGGPPEIRGLVDALGVRPTLEESELIDLRLSSGVRLISKPSKLHAPPWQLVSALLDGVGERAATWWLKPWIYTTTRSRKIECWTEAFGPAKTAGPVAIAKTGEWDGQEIGLAAPNNHAKIGVSTSGDKLYAILGDLNQQGAVAPPGCDKSQNARGGLFFVVENKTLFDGIDDLIAGDTAPTGPAKK